MTLGQGYLPSTSHWHRGTWDPYFMSQCNDPKKSICSHVQFEYKDILQTKWVFNSRWFKPPVQDQPHPASHPSCYFRLPYSNIHSLHMPQMRDPSCSVWAKCGFTDILFSTQYRSLNISHRQVLPINWLQQFTLTHINIIKMMNG